jgi:hypothetical protein
MADKDEEKAKKTTKKQEKIPVKDDSGIHKKKVASSGSDLAEKMKQLKSKHDALVKLIGKYDVNNYHDPILQVCMEFKEELNLLTGWVPTKSEGSCLQNPSAMMAFMEAAIRKAAANAK